MAMGKNQNSQAAQTLKGLKNIKASANKLHLAKAQEKKAAAKCDVTVPGCRESMAVPEYKGTSDSRHWEGLKDGVKVGATQGFFIGDFPASLAQQAANRGDRGVQDMFTFFGVLLAPLGLVGGLIGSVIGGSNGLVNPQDYND